MTWTIEGQAVEEIPGDWEGFVYRITNNLNGKTYIGKKIFYFKKPKTVTLKNGKKVKRKVKVESDWKEYYGSSPSLSADVYKFGKENFRREIIYLCKSRGVMSYLEAKLQMVEGVLEYPELFYNGQIQCRISGSHVKKDFYKKVGD